MYKAPFILDHLHVETIILPPHCQFAAATAISLHLLDQLHTLFPSSALSEASMTDYIDYREPNRDALIRNTDPLAMRRSMTRNSHYSQPSVSASTRSWVHSTQQNPPPPPEQLSSPVRLVRPLPEPHLQPPLQYPLYHMTNGGEEEEEEYMNIDPNGAGIDTGYHTEGLGRGRSPRSASSGVDDPGPSSRSFVGGFVRGLRRLPKVVLGYGGNGDKRKFFRRGTLGTEGTATSVTGMTGNTLPRYTSNPPTPVAGPSNAQHYFQGGQIPAAPPATFHPPGPSSSQRRFHPSFRVTPPSEVIEQEEPELEYVSEPQPPQFAGPAVDSPPQEGDRTTVLVYQDSQAATAVPPSRPASTPLRRSDSTPVRRSGSHHQPSDSAEANQVPSHAQSPVLAHPRPASDYRKMGSLLSPASPTTLTTTTFTSDPSFSSELNPVKRFFSTLHRMPWIARDRVTVDYRPWRSPWSQARRYQETYGFVVQRHSWGGYFWDHRQRLSRSFEFRKRVKKGKCGYWCCTCRIA